MNTPSALKFKVWNINGHKGKDVGSKLCDPDFLNEVSSCDIVALLETHAFECDLSLPGFKLLYRKDRPIERNSRKSFGGISVFVRDYVVDQMIIKEVKSDNPDAVWLKIKKQFLNSSIDLYVAFTYLSPVNSKNKNFSKNIFSRLRKEIEKFMALGAVIILGDLNARSGSRHDFISITNDILYNDPSLHSDDAIAGIRNSEDKQKLCKRGKELISMCRELDISILNGRSIGDLFGKITCFRANGCSVVDYGLCSNDFINHVSYFKVSTIMPWLSDHCAIELSIAANVNASGVVPIKSTMSDIPAYFQWNEKCSAKIVDCLKTQNYKSQFDKLEMDQKNADSFPISELNQIFHNICKDANLKELPKLDKNKKNTNKVWFDKNCQHAKNELH